MSIVTRTGDSGTTALMYGRRVPKHHVRLEACGAIDELNASLGLARASMGKGWMEEALVSVQQSLVPIMGELATAREDQERYSREGYPRLESGMVNGLDQWMAHMEREGGGLKGWATPGATVESAALDVARAVCRRAERRISELEAAGELSNPRILTYFNRLSDVLWLMARRLEPRTADPDTPLTS